MGLLDILGGIQGGGGMARGAPAPASKGMSPIAKGLLALLAFYAMKNMQRAGTQPPPPAGPGGGMSGGMGGGLGDILGGALGGGRGMPSGGGMSGASGG